MPKFKAPEHVSAISTFAGERRADKDGVITVEDDAPWAEIAAIRAAGWTDVADEKPEDKGPAKADPPKA